MNIDLTNIETQLIQLPLLALIAVGGLIGKRLYAWLGINNDVAATSALEDAANKSIIAVAGKLPGIIASLGWDHVSVKQPLIADAVTYLIQHFPGTVQRAGIDPAAPSAAEAKLQGMFGRLYGELGRYHPVAQAQNAAPPATQGQQTNGQIGAGTATAPATI